MEGIMNCNYEMKFVTEETTDIQTVYCAEHHVKGNLKLLIEDPKTISIRIWKDGELVFTTARYESTKCNLINSNTVDLLKILSW